MKEIDVKEACKDLEKLQGIVDGLVAKIGRHRPKKRRSIAPKIRLGIALAAFAISGIAICGLHYKYSDKDKNLSPIQLSRQSPKRYSPFDGTLKKQDVSDAKYWFFDGTLKKPDIGDVKQTPSEWLDYYTKTGTVMASLPDLYHAVKYMDENTPEGKFLSDYLGMLRKEAEAPGEVSRLMTSTKVDYRNINTFFDGYDLIVEHYAYGKEDPLKKETVIKMNPMNQPARERHVDSKAIFTDEDTDKCFKLDHVLSNGYLEGWKFVQAILGTQDNPEEIKETLSKMTGVKSSEIMIDGLFWWGHGQKAYGNPGYYVGLLFGASPSGSVHLTCTPKSWYTGSYYHPSNRVRSLEVIPKIKTNGGK